MGEQGRLIAYLRGLSVLGDIVSAHQTLPEHKMVALERYLRLSKEVVERRGKTKLLPIPLALGRAKKRLKKTR